MSRGQAGWKSRARDFADLLASNGMVKSDKVGIALPSYHSSSDFTNGTLVTTDIPASAASGASFVIETTGKSYSGSQPPFSFIAQGYLYNNTIINYSGSNITGSSLTYIKAMNNGGYLSFWWPRISYWNSFNVHVRDAGGSANNRVTSIGNSIDPSAATKKVQIDLASSGGGGTLHKYKLADIPSTGKGGSYMTFSFTVASACTLLINAQATVRQNNSTHDYAYLGLDGTYIAEASVSDRTYHWATNHSFSGIWADVSAGPHTINIKNNGGGTSHGANNTQYDGWITALEI